MTDQQTAPEIPTIECQGIKVPVLGLGTFQASGSACRKAVHIALETGYRHIDTARMYQNETEVGAGIRDAGVARDTIFLTTKLQMGQLDPDGVRKSCEASLKDLDTDYVDLLLIHWPEDDMDMKAALAALSQLKSEGKIRQFGVSNFTVAWLEKAVAAADEPIFCNQIEYHPYIEQGPPMRFCREHDILVTAYSPLARGRVVKDERLAAIGRKYGKTPAQVALRWIVRQNDVVAIPKGTSEAHIRENFDIFDFSLEEADLAAIGHFEHNNRLIDPEWAPTWDT